MTVPRIAAYIGAAMAEAPDTLRAKGTVEWTAEHWQFFAFIFAALVTLAFAIIAVLPSVAWWTRVLLMVGAFVAFGWLTLRCQRFKSFLVVKVLRAIKR